MDEYLPSADAYYSSADEYYSSVDEDYSSAGPGTRHSSGGPSRPASEQFRRLLEARVPGSSRCSGGKTGASSRATGAATRSRSLAADAAWATTFRTVRRLRHALRAAKSQLGTETLHVYRVAQGVASDQRSPIVDEEPVVFQLTDAAPLRELDLRLDPGRAVPVVVIDREHDPVANAKVFVVADAKLRARGTTDDDGRASVAVPAGEPATLFVAAEEGPFAMMRVPRPGEMGNGKGRLQVYVPSSASSLLIRAQTTDGKAMRPFSLLMRYNGEIMPVEVAEELAELQGLQLATGPDSEAHLRNIPSGSYEFWPYRSQAEAESIVAAGSTFLAPIQVNVWMGENKIAVKFASRRGGG